jgi:hypothetical protein
MNESNRRIASINRIDELNQRIEFQNDPKRPVDSLMGRQDRSKRAQESPRAPQDPLKTAQKPPKTIPRGPKSTQERPKTPPRRPQSPPRRPKTPQEPSWDGLGGHLGTPKKQDRKQDRPGEIRGQQIGRNDPKTSQKSRRKMHHFFIPLGAVLERSWVDLGSDVGAPKRSVPGRAAKQMKNENK